MLLDVHQLKWKRLNMLLHVSNSHRCECKRKSFVIDAIHLALARTYMCTAMITEKPLPHCINKVNDQFKLSWSSLGFTARSYCELGEQELSSIQRTRKRQYKINFSNLVAFLIKMPLQPKCLGSRFSPCMCVWFIFKKHVVTLFQLIYWLLSNSHC